MTVEDKMEYTERIASEIGGKNRKYEKRGKKRTPIDEIAQTIGCLVTQKKITCSKPETNLCNFI